MARAFLQVTPELTEAFLSAQDDLSIRAMKISIAEETINLHSTINCQGTPQEDFQGPLHDVLVANEAAIILFCLDSRAIGTPAKWVLIAWVPDDCKVRDKMLYSSSREDLKRSLGLGYFVGEYYANTLGDMTWDQFIDYVSRERIDGPLTMKEQLILEEKALTHSESHATKATAMGALPFELSSSVITALSQLQNGEVNWVEMYLNQETVELGMAKTVDVKEPLQSHVNESDGRFLALRLPDPANNAKSVFYFVYSCPESTLVRTKMTMSSSKATVLAAATSQGITFTRNFEIRSADEIDDQLRNFHEDSGGGSGVGSASAALSHAKPSRPGRGKAKVSKFKADDEG